MPERVKIGPPPPPQLTQMHKVCWCGWFPVPDGIAGREVARSAAREANSARWGERELEQHDYVTNMLDRWSFGNKKKEDNSVSHNS